ncbi:MAG TPA: response regulator [Rhizobacter sp.]|nr:response regulator [Rhizobacter sp.]
MPEEANTRLDSIGKRVQLLVIACIVPAWLAASVIAFFAYQRERDDRITSSVLQARGLVHQVERELALSVGVLETLATSSHIDDGNYRRFHEQASQVLRQSSANNIVLFDTTLQGLVSAAQPYGSPLFKLRHDRFPSVIPTARPAVSEMFVGEVSKQLQVAAAVPVMRNGTVIGRLEMVFSPERFARIIEQQSFSHTWPVGIVDSAGHIVARNRDAELFVGRLAAPPLLEELRARREGHFEGRSTEGIDAVGCFSQSETFGWAAAIGVPVAEMHAVLARRLGVIALTGIALLLSGIALARRLGRQIAEPVQALVAPALAIGRGEAATLPPPALRETAEVASALAQAQQLLREREASRLAAEGALRDSQSRLRMALDISRIGTWELDLETNVITRSQRHDECFGYTEPVPHWTLEDFIFHVHPEDRHLIDQEIRPPAIDGEQQSWRTECRVIWPDGSVHWIASQAAVISENGKPRRIIGIVSDATPAKQAEEMRLQQVRLESEYRQAQEANRLKSEFLANMSHELRTPLNAVIGFAEILRTGMIPADSPKRGEYLGHIAAGGRHLLQLINDVLDLAKVESGKLEFHPEPVDLPRLSHEVLGVLQAEAARKRIELVVDHDPALHGLELDPARLKQVLYNFLSNAIKFTSAGGRVTLRSRADGPEHLRIEVEDTGIGIAPADQHKLFMPFQQINAGLTKQHGGTGLGLALTRQLAELQGGTVGLRSTAGQGSVFHVVLPRRPGASRTPTTPAAAAVVQGTAARPGAPRVLVVEDDVADQAKLVRALSAAGYQVDVGATAEQALQHAAERHYDAITLDLLLPDRSGLEVLATLRASALHATVPVIVVTMVTETSALAGFQVSDVLHKPLRAEEVQASLRRLGLRSSAAPRIMVVDDEAASRDLMAATLQSIGMTVLCMPDGHAALDSLDDLRPDAMVVDLLMPGMNGFDVLSALRERPAFSQLPVFVWTSMELGPADLAELSRSALAITSKTQGGIDALLAHIREWHAA